MAKPASREELVEYCKRQFGCLSKKDTRNACSNNRIRNKSTWFK